MWKIFAAALVLLGGCQNTIGPFTARQPMRIDDPQLSIGEQQQRGRDRLALPEDSPRLMPPMYIDGPGPNGR
jgi:hypothetical protein